MNIEEIQSEYIQRKKRDFDDSWAATCRRSTNLFLKYLDNEGIDVENHKFTKIDVKDYKALVESQNNDYAGTTVKNMCMSMRDFLAYLHATQDIDVNMIQTESNQDYSIYSADISPDKSTRYESETGEEIPYIRKEEHEQLLDENENQRDDLLLRLLWDTGCRPSEIVNLRLSDIDRDDLINGVFEVETSKRKNHQREVYIGSITKRRFIKWLYKGGRNAYSSYSDSSEYVFPTRKSEKMQPSLVNRQIKRLSKRAGIYEVAYERKTDTYLRGEMQELNREFARINAKSYRHSFCVRSAKNGIPLPLLADLAGHSGTESLESYTKFMPDDMKQAWQEYTRDDVGF